MFRKSGFSLIEVLATMTILGIIATISAPEFWRLRDRDQYRSEVQAFFDTIVDARNAAMTNKKCSNGSTAINWRAVMIPTLGSFTYDLQCFYDSTNYTIERATVSPEKIDLESMDFNEDQDPSVMTSSFPVSVSYIFFSGGGQSKLEYNDGSDKKAESVTNILGHTNSSFQQTICFNRVSGFPTFNKSGTTCPTY